MHIKIIKGSIEYIDDCEEALVNSELWKRYSCFKDFSKLFLVVADFNPDARRLYEKIGYTEVGCIPSLYREGITENLMMKLRY